LRWLALNFLAAVDRAAPVFTDLSFRTRPDTKAVNSMSKPPSFDFDRNLHDPNPWSQARSNAEIAVLAKRLYLG
jgi:hypothetical protein